MAARRMPAAGGDQRARIPAGRGTARPAREICVVTATHPRPGKTTGPPPAWCRRGARSRASAGDGRYRTRTVRFTITWAPDLSVTVMVKMYLPFFTR